MSIQMARRGSVSRRHSGVVLTQMLTDAAWTPVLPPTSPAYGQTYYAENANATYALGTYLSYGRFEVHPGDCWQQDIDQGNGYLNSGWGIHERSEVYGMTVPLDTHAWVSYSIRITLGSAPTDPPQNVYDLDGGPFCGVGDFHSTTAWNPALGSNPIPLVSDLLPNGLIAIQTRSYLQANPNSNPITQYTMNIMDGTWHRIVHHILFYRTTGTLSGTSLLQSWLDGTPVFNTDGILMGSAQTTGHFWKFGIYRSQSTGTSIVEYANMEVATGATALQSRIATPLTIPAGV